MCSKAEMLEKRPPPSGCGSRRGEQCCRPQPGNNGDSLEGSHHGAGRGACTLHDLDPSRAQAGDPRSTAPVGTLPVSPPRVARGEAKACRSVGGAGAAGKVFGLGCGLGQVQAMQGEAEGYTWMPPAPLHGSVVGSSPAWRGPGQPCCVSVPSGCTLSPRLVGVRVLGPLSPHPLGGPFSKWPPQVF